MSELSGQSSVLALDQLLADRQLSHQDQYQQDHEHKSQAAARSIPPGTAVRPGGNRPEQQQDYDDQQNKSKSRHSANLRLKRQAVCPFMAPGIAATGVSMHVACRRFSSSAQTCLNGVGGRRQSSESAVAFLGSLLWNLRKIRLGQLVKQSLRR
jgi:hypothetical protein